MTLRYLAANRPVRARLLIATLVALALTAVSTAAVWQVRASSKHRGNLYDPARGALIEAQWQLSQLLPYKSENHDELNPVRQHLQAARGWVDTAENADPRHRNRIAALEAKLKELDEAERTVQASAARRDRIYQELAADLQKVITQYN